MENKKFSIKGYNVEIVVTDMHKKNKLSGLDLFSLELDNNFDFLIDLNEDDKETLADLCNKYEIEQDGYVDDLGEYNGLFVCEADTHDLNQAVSDMHDFCVELVKELNEKRFND